jgi:hypothetical protein
VIFLWVLVSPEGVRCFLSESIAIHEMNNYAEKHGYVVYSSGREDYLYAGPEPGEEVATLNYVKVEM